MRLRRITMAAMALALAGCAAFGIGDPVSVTVAGVEPISGEGAEARFALKLRVQNPNDTAIDYDGVFAQLDVRGSKLASGVSDQKGSVPRYGERVIVLPMSISLGAVVRQVLGIATGEQLRFDYELRGKLASPGFGDRRFEAKGELQLPATLSGKDR